MKINVWPQTLVITALLALAGCGSSDKQDRPKAEYYGSSSKSSAGLAVPPDLTQTDPNKNISVPGASAPNDPQAGAVLANTAVLAEPENVRMLREGQQRWLVVDEVPAKVWPQLVSFWEKDGIKLEVENPQSGVIETDWLINYADLTSDAGKLFRGLLNRITSSGERDKYRFRLDHGIESGTSEIYVSHQGLEEVPVGPINKAIGNYKWVARPADPGLEIEVMRQLMVFLGVEEEQAEQIVEQNAVERAERARLVVEDTDEPILILDDGFARAWQRVGLALDRSGVTIAGRNRDQGGYVIEVVDTDKEEQKSGFFSRWFNRDDDEEISTYRLQVRLLPEGEAKTVVAIATEEGYHDNSEEAISLLTQLHEQLR